jgi:hypothetical protein
VESEGPRGLFSLFIEEGGKGAFLVYCPDTDEVLEETKVYDHPPERAVTEDEVEIFWADDGRKTGVAIGGIMRAIIQGSNDMTEWSVPFKATVSNFENPEMLVGFSSYLDERKFIVARKNYWRSNLLKSDPTLILPEIQKTSRDNRFLLFSANFSRSAAVFEDDGEVGYLYVFSLLSNIVVRHLHIYDRSFVHDIRRRDVRLLWSKDETKCAVSIWGNIIGIIDLQTGEHISVRIDRHGGGVKNVEWIRAFDQLIN